MPLAFHRSLTFWSGILVMAFIAWAWWDSTQWSRRLTKAPFSLASFASGIAIDHQESLLTGGLGWRWGQSDIKKMYKPDGEFDKMRLGRVFFVRPLTKGEEDVWFKGTLQFKNLGKPTWVYRQAKSCWPDRDPLAIWYYVNTLSGAAPQDWKLFVPYWVLLLGFVAPWSALLLWRARRRKRSAMTP